MAFWQKTTSSNKRLFIQLDQCDQRRAPRLCFVTNFFLIFIDDIDNGIKSRISKFADDTKISMPTFNLENCNLLQNDINSLCEWAEKWQMSFNADKCNVIHFGSNNTNYPYKMFNQLLNKSSSEKI